MLYSQYQLYSTICKFELALFLDNRAKVCFKGAKEIICLGLHKQKLLVR